MIALTPSFVSIEVAIAPLLKAMQWLTPNIGEAMQEANDTPTTKVFRGKDETGKRYIRLLVEEHVGKDKHGNNRYRCKCDCGKVLEVNGNDLRTGNTTSCGCLGKENREKALTKHGLTETPEYAAWCCAKSRCYREKDEHYHLYGARGICMAPEWVNDFAAFYAHVGPRPGPLHSIHRLDNDKNYEPGNLIWATKREQANLRRTSRWIEFNGRKQTLAQWARETGLQSGTIAFRITLGWSVERALTEPVQSHST
jgi:hypothetical protein